MNTKTEELSMEALDCVCGGGIVSDVGAVIVAASHAIADGPGLLITAASNAGGGIFGSGGASPATWPKSTWL